MPYANYHDAERAWIGLGAYAPELRCSGQRSMQTRREIMIRPFPLFDSSSEIRSGPLGLVGNQATKRLSEVVLEQTQIDRDWTSPYMKIARSFLKSHLPADGNSNTFNRFRSEIERFTLWLAIKHKKNPLELRHTDILDYLGFLEDPDRQWVSAYRTTRITYDNGVGTMNEGWCPFWARIPKGIQISA